jgi:glycosyltransferase involved in cell wall biosynthesis
VSSLKVCIDARLPGGLFGGVEQVVIGLAAGLSKLGDGDEEYLFLVHPDHDAWLEPYLSGPCRALHTRMDHPGQRGPRRIRQALRERLPPDGLRRAVIASDGTAERAGADVIHFAIQEAFTTEIPSLYQPHDLQHLHLPELFGRRFRRRREIVYRTHCERATLVGAMTSWGKRDLIRHYALSEEKVAVIPWGSILWEYPAPSEEEIARLRSTLEIDGPFLLYPAQTWAHKNHERLFEALALLRRRDRLEIPLVCPGKRNRHYRPLRHRARDLGIDDLLRFPGFVPPVELRAMYETARALVFPSLFEGWGLPVSEAFAAGLPVACSNVTSLPDLAGDAALLFDPREPEQIAERVLRLWTDETLREELAARGRERSEEFSFDHTARLLRAHYRRIAGAEPTEEDRMLLAAPALA